MKTGWQLQYFKCEMFFNKIFANEECYFKKLIFDKKLILTLSIINWDGLKLFLFAKCKVLHIYILNFLTNDKWQISE